MTKPKQNILIVGAGFSGAVAARELAEAGHSCHVIDERPHIAGNCHTERDTETGIMVHQYGPHIFNTDDTEVWNYVKRHGTFRPFTNRVKSSTERGVFSMPINLHTINQFFGTKMSPDEAKRFIESKGDASIVDPQNFEEQALKFIGRELYDAFFYGYTKKQWGCEPTELPASILKRLPVRFNYDDNYYNNTYQGIPEHGYSAVVESILDHPNISVQLKTKWEPESGQNGGYDHIIYTGPIDAFFNHSEGRLSYRTVTFEKIETNLPDYQGNAVINYPEQSIPWTRIHEHKHFTPWETHEQTLAYKEFSKETEPEDVPYYPKRLEADMVILKRYEEKAEALKNVTFLGRLATYRYMDMEKVIREALDFSADFLQQPE